DQHPHPARGRDAARWFQALRLREGPVDVRLRGLHACEARHELHRRIADAAHDRMVLYELHRRIADAARDRMAQYELHRRVAEQPSSRLFSPHPLGGYGLRAWARENGRPTGRGWTHVHDDADDTIPHAAKPSSARTVVDVDEVE